MKALGIGVRVWIGWTPNHKTSEPHLRARTGTIVYGPYPTGSIMQAKRRSGWFRTTAPFWDVAIDDASTVATVRENLLVPIDDDDPDATTEPVEQEQEA